MERCSPYALVFSAALAAATPSCKKAEAPAETRPKPEQVVFLHFNDLHGALEQAQGISCIIERVRQECERKGCHVIVTNGGDLFGNTSVSEKFKGEAEVKFLNALDVDAVVPGNHDTDYGPEVFEERMGQGEHWVAANLYKGSAGEKPLPSYVVVKAGSAKIGIAGFTFPQKWYTTGDFKFDDPLATAKELMSTLEENSDVQIALAHLENPEELEMAKQLPGFDAVLGGHDHVSPFDYCHETELAVPVCETPPDGEYIVRVDMMVDGKKVTNMGQDLIDVDDCRETSAAVSAALKSYMDAVSEMQQIIGFAKEDFSNGRRSQDGQNKANNFVAKVMLESCDAELAMINATGVRKDIPAGHITREHIVRLVFDNKIVVVEMTGAEIKNAMQAFLKRNRYFALAGFTYQTPLDPEKMYRVATINFLTDGKGPLSEAKIVSEGGQLRSAITDYLVSHSDGI